MNPGEREIIFQSPEIHGLKSFEGYVTEVFIYDNERKENLIGKHRQVIQSIIDEAELQRRIQQSKLGGVTGGAGLGKSDRQVTRPQGRQVTRKSG